MRLFPGWPGFNLMIGIKKFKTRPFFCQIFWNGTGALYFSGLFGIILQVQAGLFCLPMKQERLGRKKLWDSF
jgi:hypothetical protein